MSPTQSKLLLFVGLKTDSKRVNGFHCLTIFINPDSITDDETLIEYAPDRNEWKTLVIMDVLRVRANRNAVESLNFRVN